ncbi:AsmA-like C-terminal region-containing protein [Aquimarina sp. 2201CG5-10]|uniref:AsmA-like C-terminal region-containing protein n=1 Tax=Aquimarina callyspongiae TaxID=3098150 RepID=UPI002AB424CD|nr:AsmA-like C-terminal region-containing protein [Aquimarina sp. 2201CG5-10]MDY8136645.1 AsmA-like C-terminal region-containing protein [Aquimarina sp. 2201CG5-10]
MKKALKILGIVLLLFIIAIISIPFLFKGTIQDKVRYMINEHVNAKVDFADIDISLLRSFPQASVEIDELSIINYEPFEGDTLVYSKKIALDMSINELFKDASEPISVKEFIIDEAHIAIKTDSLGNSNFDIARKQSETPEPTPKEEESGSFTFALEHYEVNHSNILYKDDQSGTILELTDLNHKGDGAVSGEKVILNTHSDTEASFGLGDTKYLNKNKLQLDAAIELDLENQKYSFMENKALINQLPLEFNGFVQLFEKHTEVDLSFKTPSSDFKNFLAVIPETYAKNLDGVETSGDFSIQGMIKGTADDTYIPKMDITILSNNASFKYPDLPKSVSNITIDTQIKNDTGLVDDTFVKIGNLTFRIDQDTFAAKGSLLNLTGNMIVDMAVNGTLNLSNLDQAYPLQLEQDLNGIVKADIKTHFDMQSLEKEQYQNVKSSGNASISGFSYSSPETPNEIKISNADVSFNPDVITLNTLDANTGKSDLKAKGTIHNLMGFLFSKQDLKGEFDVNSNVFAVNDFMVAESDTDEKEEKEVANEEGALQIPSFLNATLNFDAKKVIYDNLELKNTKGSVKIKDETAYLENVTSNIFDGGLAFNGNVSTKSEVPSFAMSLDLSKVNIAKSFNSLELIKGLAPIAKALTGALTTQIKLNGDLKNDLTPVLTSLKGNALAEILNAKVNAEGTPLLSKLDGELNFLNLDKLNLKDIKTKLSFDDGQINVKPFDFTIDDIKITASGSHGFDSNMNYNVSLDVPAKYLGNDISGLVSQLNEQEAKSMTIALPVGVTGNFTNPKISLNTNQAISQLTQQIISKQKEKAKEQIIGKGTKTITDLLGGSNKSKDSTKTDNTNSDDQLKETAKDILGGFFKKKKKKKDSSKTKN